MGGAAEDRKKGFPKPELIWARDVENMNGATQNKPKGFLDDVEPTCEFYNQHKDMINACGP